MLDRHAVLVKLLPVSADIAEDSLSAFESECVAHGMTRRQIDELWRHAQLTLSFLLAEHGQFPCHEEDDEFSS
jgi:hypothetical protein